MSSCCADNYDLCIQQSATFEKTFTWMVNSCPSSTAGAAPAPVDLTGYTAAMQIKPFPGSTAVLYDASADITLGGPAGTVTLLIPASDTALMTWGQGVYDLLLTSPTGFVTRFLSGQASVCPGVTNAAGAQFVLLPGGQAADLPGGEGILTP